jgi:hypothetical protein
MVEVIDLKRHAEIVRGYHFLTVFSSVHSSENGNAARDARFVAKREYPRPRA